LIGRPLLLAIHTCTNTYVVLFRPTRQQRPPPAFFASRVCLRLIDG
jgi:hypothetical protein